MAKQPKVRKNSRASRRATEVDSTVSSHQNDLDSKSRVLKQLAERKLREGGIAKKPSTLEDELTHISNGTHPDQNIRASGGKVTKKGKQNKKAKLRQQRAEILKDVLNEKIKAAKERHKTVRSYRGDDDTKTQPTE